MEVYNVKDLTFTYPNEEKKAVSGADLTVYEGEFITVCGRSGCGKSTLLRCLKPSVAPGGSRSGRIVLCGRSIDEYTDKELAEKIGFISQDPENQIVCDKVWHELSFGLENLGYPTDRIRSKTAEVASFFGIEDLFHKKTFSLSGGQKQLINLASVIAMDPKILILDEPTSRLDPISAANFLSSLSKINRELGVTVIISEHRLDDLFIMSDRIAVMDSGRIISYDTPQNTAKSPNIPISDYAFPAPVRIFLNTDNEASSLCPLDVRSSRIWLKDKIKKESPEFSEIKSVPEPQKREPAITLSDVRFRYEKNGKDVICGLSEKIYKGEHYALIGGNGSGKTTTLSLISGILSPYSGHIKIHGDNKVVLLPQDPRSLFVKKTVKEDLLDMIGGKENDDDLIDRIASLFEIEDLMERHPFDLSGGEQQRAALAKLMLYDPDIILLDEPTKGIDAYFKRKLAMIVKKLTLMGKTIVTVTHDIDFCAEFASRCGVFFDGRIIRSSLPQEIFSQNNIYTTTSARIANGIIPNAVLPGDIIRVFNRDYKENYPDPPISTAKDNKNNGKKAIKKRSVPFLRIILSLLFILLFLGSEYMFAKKTFPGFSFYIELISILSAASALMVLSPKKEKKRTSDLQKIKKTPLAKKHILSLFLILILIPATVLCGVYFLNDRKFYFISLLVIIEAMLAFAAVLEGRRPKAREIALISALCAVAVAGRAAFYPLHQFKPFISIIIICGVCLGGETGFLIGAVSTFVSNFIFGQSALTPWQMFAFGLVGLLSGVLFRIGVIKKTRLSLSVFGALFAVFIYGLIMNCAVVLIYNDVLTVRALAVSCIAGLPFDIVHALSAVFFLWLISDEFIEKIDRIKTKYALINIS